VHVVGIDRSVAMLARAASRRKRTKMRRQSAGRLRLVRGDVRSLPFSEASLSMVLAPYGVLQSLLTDRDLTATLQSVARVLMRRGRFGIDLVPDVPQWREYRNRTQLKGRLGGAHLTLVESVRQEPRRRLTTFEQRYVERHGGRVREHVFELRFRTLSMRRMTRRLEQNGFSIEAVLGDYRGRPWDERADAWIILARRI
jgi:ubiquinone/menaquinone biosynthesis C-methylase UbiE